MTTCEHGGAFTGESVVFSGRLRDQFAATYSGSCSTSEAVSETITGSSMTVKYRREGDGTTPTFEKTFNDCPIELNYTQSPIAAATMSGRACGQSVSIEYAK